MCRQLVRAPVQHRLTRQSSVQQDLNAGRNWSQAASAEASASVGRRPLVIGGAMSETVVSRKATAMPGSQGSAPAEMRRGV